MAEGRNDPFIISKVFPDALGLFQTKLKPLNAIKEGCTVVLDTNVLLVPYRTSKDSLQAIHDTFAPLKKAGRLVVPQQVAREFVRNRPQRLADLYQAMKRKKDPGDWGVEANPLLASLKEFKELQAVAKELAEVRKKYSGKLQNVLDVVSGWTWDDPVSQMYSILFDGTVVWAEAPDEKAALERLELCKEHKLPPAYKDGGKDDGGIGDVLIWMTILSVGAKKKTDVLFVSGEEKPDWWYRSEGDVLYPRYELVDEFRRASGGGSFHIASLSRALALFGANETVVKQVKVEESSPYSRDPDDWYEGWDRVATFDAVKRWLLRTHTNVEVVGAAVDDEADLVAHCVGRRTMAVQLKFLSHPSRYPTQSGPRIARMISLGLHSLNGLVECGRYQEGMLIFVLPSRMMTTMRQQLAEQIAQLPRQFPVVVGVVEDGTFDQELYFSPDVPGGPGSTHPM